MGDKARFDYDAIVIGTGFGGSVTAARLAQAGARVLVLERGMRYSGDTFPALPRDGQAIADPARFVWSSEEGRLGLWDVRDLGATHAASAAGYGGGSLIYANVHLRAPQEVFEGWPKPYSRAALDPYYDLAAHMLEVDTIESAAPKLYPLRKASALRAAAHQLGRSAQAFSPPLAVRFHAGTDVLGNERGACVGCGECDSGCRHGAKNSLEHNYLTIAERERAGDEPRTGFPIGRSLKKGEPYAIIRTLAEARTITPATDDQGRKGYTVELWDHTTIDHARISPLRGRKHGTHKQGAAEDRLDEVAGPRHEAVSAPFVFVCAGAVGSTELLLRNRENLGLHAEQLGRRYFGNSDALGIVRHAKYPQQPHVGPVITTALVHRGASATDPWLMIQDGGYGPAVHALVEAVFASPVLAQRNRYYERSQRGIAPPHLGEGPSFVQPFVDPPAPVRRNASLAEGLYRTEMAHELTEIIPDQAAVAAVKLREQLEGFVAQDVEKTVDALEQLVVRGGARRLTRWAEGMTGHERVEQAAQRFLTWVARLIRKMTADGAMAEIARLAEQAPPRPPDEKKRLEAFVRANPIGVATMLVMKDRFKLNDQRTAFVEGLKLLTRRASDAAAYQKSMDHTAVLLTMGRDQQRHRLSMHRGALQAEMEPRERGEKRLYSVQERLMRDVASVLGGELRLNPAWSQAHTPITVHGQGGCAMGEDSATGVTDPCGEVYGCKGLFVMDAALFPSPVGVNPSATILAVAERNIEAFIRQQPGLKTWTAPEADAARSIDPARRARLTPEPIDSIEKSPDIIVESTGIRFDERMYGFHSSKRNDGDNALDGTRRTERLYSQHEACYIDGRIAGDSLELKLKATIEDLPAFIADPQHRGTLQGTLVLKSHDPQSPGLHERLRYLLRASGGELTVRKDKGAIKVLPKLTQDERVFRYTLEFDVPVAGSKGLMLVGHKRVRDEPGQDEWQDTTALFFCLAEIDHFNERGKPIASKTARSHGVVRVSLDEFLTEQLPSMEVFGVEPAPDPNDPESKALDPATVMWGLATFGTFFFGNVADVYMKEAGLVTRVIKRSLSLGGAP